MVLKFQKKLPYFFAFSAGSIIAVAFLDLLPESINVASRVGISIRTIMIIVVSSFFLYSLLEKFFATHSLTEDSHCHSHVMGPIGAGSLVLHSFMDGAAIGIAFQVNFSAGLIVALAVLMHDMTDGINTVAVMLKNKHSRKNAIIFLILDAIAPVLGVLIFTTMIILPEKFLVYVLAFFVGEFINIGAVTLLPEAWGHPSKKIVIAMAFGILLIMLLTSLIAI
jgi:ZIP family zinc transporter